MDTHALLVFSLTVLPLVCTPGPDILFVASQALAVGARAGLRATMGVILGYSVHSLSVALGLAAVITASPLLFEGIRWLGITYLIFIAFKLVKAAVRPSSISLSQRQVKNQLGKGFMTSLLNPKGMMVYIAILPQFMAPERGNATLQAVILSAAFMVWCAIVYSAIAVVLARLGGRGQNGEHRRLVEGMAGGMIFCAAGFMALAQR